LKKKHMLLFIFIVFIILIFLFFRYGGEVLVAKDQIDHLDDAVIVLLMGSVGDRSLGALEVYEEGNAEHIFMVQSYVSGSEALEERGLSVPGHAELSRDLLMELGVAEEDITILPGDAQSTKDEALVIADYVDKHPEMDTIILVTSEFHSFRSKRIFQHALRELDVTVYSVPTPYDPFEARGWYKDREDIQRVVSEYTKLAHFYLLERFQMR